MRCLLFIAIPMLFLSSAAIAVPPVFSTVENIECAGSDIDIGGYSDPFVVDWDGDGLKDLIVGQFYDPTYTHYGKIRWFPNEGTNESPVFTTYAYIEADGSDIVCNYG